MAASISCGSMWKAKPDLAKDGRNCPRSWPARSNTSPPSMTFDFPDLVSQLNRKINLGKSDRNE